MRQQRYKVVVLTGDEEQPPLQLQHRRRPATRALRRWWSWSWQLRLASTALLLAVMLLVIHFGG